MTKETDGIIDYFTRSGIAGVVTGINGKGHAKTSLHYASGTPSALRQFTTCCDYYDGKQGQAVDFGFEVPQWDSEGLLRIYQLFWPVRNQLQELIHSGPRISQVLLRGQSVSISLIPKDLRDAHHNHVHVAVAKGTVLALPIPTTQEASKMLGVSCVAIKAHPVRGYWAFTEDGAVFAFGEARHYGAMNTVKLNAPIVDAAITPTGNGYYLLGKDGGVFAFGDAEYAGKPQ